MVDEGSLAFNNLRDYVFTNDVNEPDRLYHYSSQQGLIGILSSKTLWATRIQFLNDSLEFGYTVELLRNALRVGRDRVTNFAKAAAFMDECLECVGRMPIHVACFSEEGDSLSQWRGYGPGAGGFSIGFDTRKLLRAPGLKSCFLAPCIYDVQKQTKIVNSLMDYFFDTLPSFFGEMPKREDDPKDAKHRVFQFFYWDVVFFASLLKHPSFKEEREWRIVTRELPDDPSQIAVRQGKVVPIPYFKLGLCESGEQLDIEVVVGPTPEMKLAKASVKTLLKIYDCTGSARSSAIPYREL